MQLFVIRWSLNRLPLWGIWENRQCRSMRFLVYRFCNQLLGVGVELRFLGRIVGCRYWLGQFAKCLFLRFVQPIGLWHHVERKIIVAADKLEPWLVACHPFLNFSLAQLLRL